MPSENVGAFRQRSSSSWRFRRHPELFLISDLYRVDTEIAEVHVDIARSFLKSIIPLLHVPYEIMNSVQFFTTMTTKTFITVHFILVCQMLFGDVKGFLAITFFFISLLYQAETYMVCVNIFMHSETKLDWIRQ